MKQQLRRLWILALMLLTLGLGLAGGVGLDRQVLATSFPPNIIPPDAAPEFRLMAEAWNEIQQVYVDRAAVQTQTLEWLTPSGRIIWHKGIAPDVMISLPPDEAPLFPEAEREMTPAQLRGSGDQQLLDALKRLSRQKMASS